MDEISRQYKVLGMMTTAHSVLRDRYRYISMIVDVFLLVVSLILNVLIFTSDQYLMKLTGISPDIQKLIAGIASVTVFAISIVLLQVKWKEKGENHAKAQEQVFKLLQESRVICSLQDGPGKNEAAAEFGKKYVDVLNSVVGIPEKEFNALKMRHYRKVELSKMIEKHPGSRLFILKFRIFVNSFKKS